MHILWGGGSLKILGEEKKQDISHRGIAIHGGDSDRILEEERGERKVALLAAPEDRKKEKEEIWAASIREKEEAIRRPPFGKREILSSPE